MEVKVPYKDKEKRRERQNIRRKEHLDAGLCFECNKPSTISIYCMYHWYFRSLRRKSYYMKHAEELRIYQKGLYQRLLMEGRCVKCGIVKVEGEGVFCVSCRGIASYGALKGVLKYETAD